MGKKVHNSRKHQEQFVPPKPLYIESDTTGDARPPSLAFMARHYRSEYDLEKIKVYNNHAMHTCYNLPLEDVIENFETPCVSEVVSSLKSGAQNASDSIQSIMTSNGVRLNNISDITNTKNIKSTTNMNKVGSISFNSGMKMSNNAISGVNNLNTINVSGNNLSNVGSISFQNGDTIPRVSKTIELSQSQLNAGVSTTTFIFDLTKNPITYTQGNNTGQTNANGPLKSGDLISFKGTKENFMPISLQFKNIPSDVSSFYFVANNSSMIYLKTDSANIEVNNGILYTFMKLGGKFYAS